MRGVRRMLVPLVTGVTAVLFAGCGDSGPGPDPDPPETVLAIVDVMTLNAGEEVPVGFTGVAFSQCTEPYLPGTTGDRTSPSDVNAGIGGDTKYIWVEYEQLPVTSDVPVLVELAVAHWPYWQPNYPASWVPAGPLTTGTWSDCWRNGLNARYLPLSETAVFVSTLCLSWTTSGSANSCPDSALTDEAYWPRESSDLDIHRGCGDDHFVYLSYYRPTIVR